MDFLINNWYIVFGLLAIVVSIIYFIYKFFGLPTKEQKTKILNWLIWACNIAEKELGEKTGELKLRLVYDMFISKFPVTAKLVSYDTFSQWVDEALVELEIILEDLKQK